jgi:hypothetical protein
LKALPEDCKSVPPLLPKGRGTPTSILSALPKRTALMTVIPILSIDYTSQGDWQVQRQRVISGWQANRPDARFTGLIHVTCHKPMAAKSSWAAGRITLWARRASGPTSASVPSSPRPLRVLLAIPSGFIAHDARDTAPFAAATGATKTNFLPD